MLHPDVRRTLRPGVVLALAGLGLFVLIPNLDWPVSVTVCNQVPDEAVHEVKASTKQGAPVELGTLAPGACRTVDVPVRGDNSVRLAWRLGEERLETGGTYVEEDYAIGFDIHRAGVELTVPQMVRWRLYSLLVPALCLWLSAFLLFLAGVRAIDVRLNRPREAGGDRRQ